MNSNNPKDWREVAPNPYRDIRYQPHLDAFTVENILSPDDAAPVIFTTLQDAITARDYQFRDEIKARKNQKTYERLARKGLM